MSQTRKGSIIEVCCNTGSGILIAALVAHVIFPWYGIEINTPQILSINVIFTVVSICRSYVWRRVFVRFFRG